MLLRAAKGRDNAIECWPCANRNLMPSLALYTRQANSKMRADLKADRDSRQRHKKNRTKVYFIRNTAVALERVSNGHHEHFSLSYAKIKLVVYHSHLS